jgi:hypothetical protein
VCVSSPIPSGFVRSFARTSVRMSLGSALVKSMDDVQTVFLAFLLVSIERPFGIKRDRKEGGTGRHSFSGDAGLPAF